MEVHQANIQYLRCMNCPRLLGQGSLICGLGHPSCTNCGKDGEQCITCEKYVSGIRIPGFDSDKLHRNLALDGILTKCFSRCRNSLCNKLIPLSIYEDHVSDCTQQASVVACILGCGVLKECLSNHLISKHGFSIEENLDNQCLRIYPEQDDWLTSKWPEKIISFNERTSLLICPVVENRVFSLGMYNLSARNAKINVKVKKGWSSIKFGLTIPNYDERLVQTKSPIFWNCEVNTLKKSYLDVDDQGKACLKILLREIVE